MVPPLPAGEAKRLWLEGTAEFRQRSLHNARACFDRALAVDPGSPWLLSNRSAVLLSLECIDAALRDAEKCITLSPQWSKGFIRAAMVMRHVGRYPDALQYLQKGLEGNANDPELQTLLSCTTTEDLFEAALARVSACDSPPRSSQSPPARGGRRPSASTARSDGGATPPRLRAADADSASPARRASLSAQQGLTPPRRPAATPFSGLSPLPSSPGARRIVREDGTSFHTFFTSPLPHSGRSALNAFPTPADSRCRTASPPGVVVSQEGYTPRLSAGRLAAAACAFAVPGVVFALVVGDQLAWDGGGGWPDACGFDVGAAWVLLLACAAAWGIALGGVVPAPPAKQPARFSTAASVVLPLLVLATAVVGGLLATGSHGFSSVILVIAVEKCPLAVLFMAGFHIAVTAYTAGALASCAELPDGLTKSEAGILSKWLAPGLLLHVALTAFGVFRWCTALKLAPSVDSALVTPASAELLLCVASLAILSVGLRCAEKAARKAPDSSHLLERTTEARKLSHPFGLPAREWLWMGLVGVLVTTFVTSRDEQECECPENERKWAAFGL